MQSKFKDRLVDVLIILVFLAIIAGTAYAIIRTMTTWTIKELG